MYKRTGNGKTKDSIRGKRYQTSCVMYHVFVTQLVSPQKFLEKHQGSILVSMRATSCKACNVIFILAGALMPYSRIRHRVNYCRIPER